MPHSSQQDSRSSAEISKEILPLKFWPAWWISGAQMRDLRDHSVHADCGSRCPQVAVCRTDIATRNAPNVLTVQVELALLISSTRSKVTVCESFYSPKLRSLSPANKYVHVSVTAVMKRGKKWEEEIQSEANRTSRVGHEAFRVCGPQES
ncbi:hypothetical protein EYF80_007210 [Liparis tanakae]|uniref:Uncharacterized protein n=1 Tax=Liparis tanakae TaxID=230148 RepID=A0A4Z2IZI1_9TELE|nr:hypothetical protein EYF80_007210 [Liparis tanakae]